MRNFCLSWVSIFSLPCQNHFVAHILNRFRDVVLLPADGDLDPGTAMGYVGLARSCRQGLRGVSACVDGYIS